MSDKFEQFIRANKEMFNTNEPSPELWSRIESGISGQAAAGGSASAMGGSAKLGALWKAGLGVAAIIATGLTIYFAMNSGAEQNITQNSNSPETIQDMALMPAPFINPVSESINVEYFTIAFDAEKGTSWKAPSGTILEFEENTFVDANGLPVKGEVQVRYREFHDAIDILFSGITMEFKDAGKVYNFQTAGMMEIRGSQGGEDVFIAPNKSISIGMASYTDEDDHRLYFLDENARRWKDIGQAEMKANEEKVLALKKLPKVPAKPHRPSKIGETEKAFDFAVDYEDFPELKPFKNIKWEMISEKEDSAKEWIFQRSWSHFELQAKDSEQGIYTMLLKSKKGSVEITVAPVMEGKGYEKAIKRFNKKLAKYEKIKIKAEKERARLQMQADIMRYFKVQNFGIYNCDRFLRMDNLLRFSAEFNFQEMEVDQNKLTIFMITGDRRGLFPLDKRRFKSFAFNPNEYNCLVAALPDKRFAVFTNSEFKEIDLNGINEDGGYTFNMKPTATRIQSMDGLRIALNF